MRLDGDIPGPNGKYDWIGTDSEVDFAAFWTQFDALLMGRRSFELAVQTRGKTAFLHLFYLISYEHLAEQVHLAASSMAQPLLQTRSAPPGPAADHL
jgi:dihydrofolate reductase